MKIIATTLFSALFLVSAVAEESTNLVKALEPMRPYLKTWKGHFKNSTPEKPNFDVQRWERCLNGRAVRVLHSVNNGSYGGETLIVPNPKTSALEFYYFTTAGFYTHGTVEFEGKKMLTNEEVSGNENGITKVKATSELLSDGRMRVITKYFKNGAWEDGRDMTYEESNGAQVLFR